MDLISYLDYYKPLLRSVTDIITKCDSNFTAKCDKSLIQNSSRFLNKMRQFYNKMKQSLQNATVSLKKTSFCKMRCCMHYYLLGFITIVTVSQRVLRIFRASPKLQSFKKLCSKRFFGNSDVSQ